MTKIYFIPGIDNIEYWMKIKELKEKSAISFRWEGPYGVITYEKNGEIWEDWEDMDFGIPSYLERIK